MPDTKQDVLVSWIGGNDLNSAQSGQDGPILSTIKANTFDRIELLYNYPDEEVASFLVWLKNQVVTPINAAKVTLSSPVDFADIYQAASALLNDLSKQNKKLSILISPGTPAMQAVWILLGKTRYECLFYQSSKEQGVELVEIPFELSAEYIPKVSKIADEKLINMADAQVPIDAAFDNIITRNPRMMALKSQAQILAQKTVPVLIYGETGTGKELFARAIHNASSRQNKPFVAINCGAIPKDLADSVLFGHKKGAFTGAVSDKPGVFQQADGGTLFLDEFGELTPEVQVRLLRVLQESRLTPVGATSEISVDVRIITATHKNLMDGVIQGTFREDLFYRIAVGVLHLPPIRHREGDLILLTEMLLESLSKQDESLSKKLSVEAKNLILKHPWHGNIRELQSTLLRAVLWSETDSVTGSDLESALFKMPTKENDLLSLDVSQGVDIQKVIGDLVKHYVLETLAFTGQNKTQAAQLLGLKSQQTLTNWMEKYGISQS